MAERNGRYRVSTTRALPIKLRIKAPCTIVTSAERLASVTDQGHLMYPLRTTPQRGLPNLSAAVNLKHGKVQVN
jgi:hypothetical protein